MTRITARVVPRSQRTSVEVRPDGTLVIRVRAAPEGGKANREATAALADHLGIPRSSVVIRHGATSRSKVFEVPGNAV
ncbi:MAG: DUF167 domain-containing protein [Actinomycetota bacterium]